jgi:hypothetical protein
VSHAASLVQSVSIKNTHTGNCLSANISKSLISHVTKCVLTACGIAVSDNNSIQFNGYSLTCRLNSTSANYKASTNATQKNTNKEKKYLIDKKQYCTRTNMKAVLGKSLHPET